MRNITIVSCLALSAVLGVAAILSHRWPLQSAIFYMFSVWWPRGFGDKRCVQPTLLEGAQRTSLAASQGGEAGEEFPSARRGRYRARDARRQHGLHADFWPCTLFDDDRRAGRPKLAELVEAYLKEPTAVSEFAKCGALSMNLT